MFHEIECHFIIYKSIESPYYTFFGVGYWENLQFFCIVKWILEAGFIGF